MQDNPKLHIQLTGQLVAELLDQNEYHSNIGNVAGISTEQICLLRRVKHELVPFKLEYLDVHDCREIEYHKETVYYRIVGGIVSFIAAAILAYMVLIDPDGISPESGPLIALAIGLLTFGIRFVTSFHRHVLRFDMPEETLVWESPPIDFDSKAEAAHAVRDYARERGILRQVAA